MIIGDTKYNHGPNRVGLSQEEFKRLQTYGFASFVCPGIPEFTENNRFLMPLQDIKYTAMVNGGLANVSLTQKYFNPYVSQTIDVKYNFPINSKAVFDSVEAIFKNKKVIGEIKEKQKARQEFEERKARGDKVVYAEIHETMKDVMTMELGNLGPLEEISITLKFIIMLDVHDETNWLFRIPCTLTPRYQLEPQEMINQGIYPRHFLYSSQEVKNMAKGCEVAPDFLINKYTWDVEVNIYWPGTGAKNIYCLSHSQTAVIENHMNLIQVRFKREGEEGYQEQYPDRDFEVVIEDKQLFTNSCLVAKAPEMKSLNKNSPQYAAMLQFVPDLYKWYADKKSVVDQAQQQEPQSVDIYADEHYDFLMESTLSEFVFILDRSGSMSGSRMEKASEALIFFLKSLPFNSKFNIVSFGSSFTCLFNESVDYNTTNMNIALKLLENVRADMGGTEIYQPIQWAFNSNFHPNYQRNIFLLTDGQVSNEDSIFRLIKEECRFNRSRVFSIGIGSGCAENLIKESARLGNGRAVILSTSSDNQEPVKYFEVEDQSGFFKGYGNENVNLFSQKRYSEKNEELKGLKTGKKFLHSTIINLLDSALTPSLSNFKVDFDERYVSVISPLPDSSTFVVRNQPFFMFVLLKNEIEEAENLETTITIQYFNSATKTTESRIFNLSLSGSIISADPHKLCISNLIRAAESSRPEDKVGKGYYLEKALNDRVVMQGSSHQNQYISGYAGYEQRMDNLLKTLAVGYQVLSQKHTAFICVVEEKEDFNPPFPQNQKVEIEVKNYDENQTRKALQKLPPPMFGGKGKKGKRNKNKKKLNFSSNKQQLRNQTQDLLDSLQYMKDTRNLLSEGRENLMEMNQKLSRASRSDSFQAKSDSVELNKREFYKTAKKSSVGGFMGAVGGMLNSVSGKFKSLFGSKKHRELDCAVEMNECLAPYEDCEEEDIDSMLTDFEKEIAVNMEAGFSQPEKKMVSGVSDAFDALMSETMASPSPVDSAELFDKLVNLQKPRGGWDHDGVLLDQITTTLKGRFQSADSTSFDELVAKIREGGVSPEVFFTLLVYCFLRYAQSDQDSIFLILKKCSSFLRKNYGTDKFKEIDITFSQSLSPA